MIIQVRSTSGGGKSWVMKQLMERLGPFEGILEKGRKKPLFYSNAQDVCILGHYESACGGCDNIGSAAAVYELIQRLEGGTYNGNKRIILCEGLLLSEDSKWTSQLNEIRVIYLTTDVEQCIAQIKSRRALVGNEKPLKEDNTRNRVKVIVRSRVKLLESGVMCRRCTAKQAPGIILNWIKELQDAK